MADDENIGRMIDHFEAIERAKEIVSASEWEGDMRVNMTRIIGAGRVLAKELEYLEHRINEMSQGNAELIAEIAELKELKEQAVQSKTEAQIEHQITPYCPTNPLNLAFENFNENNPQTLWRVAYWRTWGKDNSRRLRCVDYFAKEEDAWYAVKIKVGAGCEIIGVAEFELKLVS